ncbi:MAG: glycosyltransferase [Ferruginibacter sp.]
MQKKKIALLINSLHGGGAERMVSVLANGLKDDFEIHIVLLENRIDYILSEGQIVKALNNSAKSFSILNMLKLPMLAYSYAKYCKKNKIELSVSFLNRASYINTMAKSLYNASYKAIVCERTHQLSWLEHTSALNKGLTTFLLKKYYNKANLIIANTRQIKKDLKILFGINVPIEVVYNTVDIQKIALLTQEKIDLKIDPAYFYFINVGGFRIEKNHKMLIDAMSKLNNRTCKLILLGKGKLETELISQVQKLGLTDSIFFVGHQQNPFKYVAKANCFVLSSNVEGMPNVLLEAMACDTPIVSTDCLTGPREILAPASEPDKILTSGFEVAPYGILCAQRNADALAAAMGKMISDIELQKNYKNIYPERIRDFGTSVILQQFSKIFSE